MRESHETHSCRVRVDSAGRIVIPADLRDELGIEPSHDLILSRDGRGIRLQTFDHAVRAAQDAFADYRVAGVSVVD